MLRNTSFLVSSSHTASFSFRDLEKDSWPNTALRGQPLNRSVRPRLPAVMTKGTRSAIILA